MILKTKKLIKDIYLVKVFTHCGHYMIQRAFVAENKYIAEEKMLNKLSNMEKSHGY